ncbi:hypothetical protein ACI3PL_19835, partial [Lacticaseibacillus paracasei]
ENARTLSDGSIAVNPLLIQDDKGYATAVDQADTTPKAKAKALAQMPQMQKAQARQLIPALLNTPDIFPGESYKSYLARRATEDESFAAMPQEDQA